MIGNRKLLLSLSVLLSGTVLAWGGHLSGEAVEMLMWTLALGTAGNAAEHWAKRGQT